jgi:hypothetical protein
MGARRLRMAVVGGMLAVALAFAGMFAGDDREGHAEDREIRLRERPEQHDETQGVYRRDVVLVDDPTIVRILGPEGEVLARRVGLAGLRQLMPDEARRKDGDRILTQILATISVLRVSGETDPLDLAIAVRQQERDLEASPVHVIGLASHWRYSPGTPPADLATLPLPKRLAAPDAKARTVAVIDTGFITGTATRSAASSTLRGVRALSIEDREKPGLAASLKGHGTFVASLIRQIDPTLRVVVGRLGAIPRSVALDGHDGGDIRAPMLSDELHLFAAVIRMKQHVVSRGIDTVALNLSLGTPASTSGIPRSGDIDGLAVGVRAAIDHWNRPAGWRGKQAPPVIAAAGNHDGETALEPEAPFVPGAYSDVYSVVALDGSGAPAPFSFLGWPADLTMLKAPGADIVGVRRVAGTIAGEDQVWSWGGTSFATALVSGQTATAVPPESVEMSAVGPPPGGPPPDVLVIVP